MKKIFYILFFIAGQKLLFAQSYYTLPDSNSNWIVVRFLSTPFTYQWFNYYASVNKNDTVINSKIYSKLFEQLYYGGYVGAFRSDTAGKTWCVPQGFTQEYLIMDVSKNVGDTVSNLLTPAPPPFFLETVVIDSVRYITVGPYTLKQLSVHSIIGTAPYWNWIEKIGCSSGFFNSIANYSMEFETTDCMSFNDTIYF